MRLTIGLVSLNMTLSLFGMTDAPASAITIRTSQVNAYKKLHPEIADIWSEKVIKKVILAQIKEDPDLLNKLAAIKARNKGKGEEGASVRDASAPAPAATTLDPLAAAGNVIDDLSAQVKTLQSSLAEKATAKAKELIGAVETKIDSLITQVPVLAQIAPALQALNDKIAEKLDAEVDTCTAGCIPKTTKARRKK